MLLSPSPNSAAAAKDVEFMTAARADAGRVLFETSEVLVAGDTDTHSDVYAWDGGLTLLTPGPNVPYLLDVSDDAEVLLISTIDQLLPTDTDNSYDLYRSTPSGLVHVLQTNQDFDMTDGRLDPGGVRTAYSTAEQVAADDHDEEPDVYVRGP